MRRRTKRLIGQLALAAVKGVCGLCGAKTAIVFVELIRSLIAL